MISIRVSIRNNEGADPEVIEHSLEDVDSLSNLVSGLESVRSQTNAVLTKHVEIFRQSKGIDTKQEDLEDKYMEQDPEEEEDNNEAPNKIAKQN